jgi:hypothetical protein
VAIILTLALAALRRVVLTRVLNTQGLRAAFYFASAVFAGLLLALITAR